MRREIRAHTGLRGIAALLVVGYHQQFATGYKLPFETTVFGRSYLMVDLFFILSGFVLSYVYASDGRVPDAGSFFRARFARVYPLHVFALFAFTFVTVAISELLSATGHQRQDLGPARDWLQQLVLLNAWIPARNEWNLPSWSISAEAFAYMLFPLIVSLNGKIMQAALFIGAFLFYLLVGNSLDISVGLAPVRCLAGFGLGMLLFYHRNQPVRSLAQLLAFAWIAVVLSLPVADPVIIPAFAMLVLATWRDEGIVAHLLSSRPLHWLGERSYSVYLMHFTVCAALWFVWIRTVPRLGLPLALERGLFLFVTFGAVLAISHMTFRYIEKPAQRMLLRRRKTLVVAAP